LVIKENREIQSLYKFEKRKKEKGGKRKKEGLERKIEEPIGAQLKLVLGLLLIEVRGLVFNYNQLVVAFSLVICLSA